MKILRKLFFAILIAISVGILFSFLTACSSDSSDNTCPVIACENGGTFKDCKCECPAGYDGPNCQTKLTPTSVNIVSVLVKSFPNQNNGLNWDSTTTADMYINIENSEGILYSSNQYYANAISNGIDFYTFDLQPAVTVTDLSQIYYISIWDYDAEDTPANPDDYIGAVAMQAYDSEKGFPSSMTFSDIDNQIIVEVFFNYKW